MIRRSVGAVPGAVVPAHPGRRPDPVLGSDGKIHVASELVIVNQSSAPTTLTSVEVLDPAKRDTVIDTIDGPSLVSFLRLTGGDEGTTFAPSTSVSLFVESRRSTGPRSPARTPERRRPTCRCWTSAAEPRRS